MIKFATLVTVSTVTLLAITPSVATAGSDLNIGVDGRDVYVDVYSEGTTQIGLESRGDDTIYRGEFRGEEIYSQVNAQGHGTISVQQLEGNRIESGQHISASNTTTVHRALGENIDIGSAIHRPNSSVELSARGRNISVFTEVR